MSFLVDVANWFGDRANWRGTNGVPNRLWEHVFLSVRAMAVAIVVGLPVAVVLGHVRRGGLAVVTVANVGRALPSFAIIVVAFQVFGFGWQAPLLALVLLALPAIVTYAYVGVRDVDARTVEAARGTGMTGAQVLWRVEIPMASPLIMGGLRVAVVTVVATATLAALIDGGGFGNYILDGIARQDTVLVFAGSLLTAALSIGADLAMGGLQRLVVPAPLRRRTNSTSPRDALVPGVPVPDRSEQGEPA